MQQQKEHQLANDEGIKEESHNQSHERGKKVGVNVDSAHLLACCSVRSLSPLQLVKEPSH